MPAYVSLETSVDGTAFVVGVVDGVVSRLQQWIGRERQPDTRRVLIGTDEVLGRDSDNDEGLSIQLQRLDLVR